MLDHYGCLDQSVFPSRQILWEASVPCESLWGWKKILIMRGEPRILLKLIMGNGESVFVWHEDEPLVQQYGNSYRIVYDSNKGCFGVKMSCILFGSGSFFCILWRIPTTIFYSCYLHSSWVLSFRSVLFFFWM